jgi:hypothetical protein
MKRTEIEVEVLEAQAMRVACIGSREIPFDAADACREMGLELARAGYTVVTGATPGRRGEDEWAGWADGAFASGAWYADPSRLVVCLPWQHFPRGSGAPPADIKVAYAEEHPEWEEAAKHYWEEQRVSADGPWAMVRRAQRQLHIRNVGIILQAQLVLAWPAEESEGTRFAMGFAEWRKTPVIDLSQAPWRAVLAALLAQARLETAE